MSQQETVAPTAVDAATSRTSEAIDEEAAHRVFNFSIVVSAVRCLLTYVVFPFVAPFVGLTNVGPVVGVAVGVVAIVANVVSIRRMRAAQHKWRTPVSIVNLAMIGLVLYLVADDLRELIG